MSGPRTEDAVLITGGAGFIGCNLAHRLACDGRRVLVFDNLSRRGVEENLAWLVAMHGGLVEWTIGDVRDAAAVETVVARASAVYHFAAQVAVTSSLADPRHDFAVNAAGTLTLLEALRARREPPPLVFTSTNKVYGALPGIEIALRDGRHAPRDARVAATGVDETQPIAFASPYGCSKGAADQYVLDYARTYGLPATVFRMSCIYGPHQFGTEDQGWVAHFLMRALAGEPVVLYGDGRQVRDVLYVDDLVEALHLAERRVADLKGHAYNIGGGADNATSLLELLDRLAPMIGRTTVVRFDAWRPGDQPWYVSDCGAFSARTGWRPRVGIEEGLARLCRWLTRRADEDRPAPVGLRAAS